MSCTQCGHIQDWRDGVLSHWIHDSTQDMTETQSTVGFMSYLGQTCPAHGMSASKTDGVHFHWIHDSTQDMTGTQFTVGFELCLSWDKHVLHTVCRHPRLIGRHAFSLNSWLHTGHDRNSVHCGVWIMSYLGQTCPTHGVSTSKTDRTAYILIEFMIAHRTWQELSPLWGLNYVLPGTDMSYTRCVHIQDWSAGVHCHWIHDSTQDMTGSQSTVGFELCLTWDKHVLHTVCPHPRLMGRRTFSLNSW